MSIGENIIKRRKAINMKAAELCRRAGITSAYMSQIEKDKRIPTLDVLQKIANELNVTVSDLLGETTLNLPEEQLQLLDQTKDLSPEQIKALITVVKAFNKDITNHAEVYKNNNINITTPKKATTNENKYIAKAAHYEGEEGLNDEEQSAIQNEIDKIKEQYNPDGTKKSNNI